MQSPGAHDYSELCVAVRNEKLAKRPLNVGNHLSHSSSNPSPVKIVLAVPCLRGTEVVPLHYLEYLLGRIVFSHYKSLENEVALSTTKFHSLFLPKHLHGLIAVRISLIKISLLSASPLQGHVLAA